MTTWEKHRQIGMVNHGPFLSKMAQVEEEQPAVKAVEVARHIETEHLVVAL